MSVQDNYSSNEKTIQLAIDNMLTTLSNEIITKYKELDLRMEAMEKQIATLVLAYGEQAVFMEALVGQVAFATEEAQKQFHEVLKDARKSMLEVMKDGAKTFVEPGDKNIGDALSNLASEKLSDIDK